ncbi:MAG TPA: M50 family metallopeptidase [Candidatus Eremiobacteraceae bacterium]|nr:M50 family metallopeptidase [Candidatus Eremiobacteraceae bacterium]
MSKAALFVNSALGFAFAELLTAALHETGHGLMAQAFGFSPKIYAFYEDNPTGTIHQSLAILAAGPVVSLMLGLLFRAWYRSGVPRYSLGQLLLFWMAWLGIMQFVNYLIVTPWLTAGDTAQIADLLHVPTWGRYLVSAVGWAALIFLTRPAAHDMLCLAPESEPLDTPRDRRRLILRSFYLPLLAGTLLTALGGFGGQPMVVFYGMLATIGNIDVVALSLYRTGDGFTLKRAPGEPLRIEPVAIVLYLIMLALYIFVLARGLPV